MLEEYPVIIAENRDASINSKETPPDIVFKRPKIFSAIDINSDGTWFGINEYGVVVGLTNLYPKTKKIKFPALKGGVFRSWLNEIGLCFYYPVSEYI